jgi:hypothetical protein
MGVDAAIASSGSTLSNAISKDFGTVQLIDQLGHAEVWVGEHLGAPSLRTAEDSLRAAAKSPELMLCRYGTDSTSVTFRSFGHHGGTTTDASRRRSRVASSTRRLFTVGLDRDPPASVVSVSASAWPLRVTNRRPVSSRSSANT